ncbi:MAG: porin family protein [Alphaproteobacteria bacterium]|nr:porin family protein [Alphaproteobacteria bacterium]
MNKYFLTALLGLSLTALQAKAENVYIPYLGIDGIYNRAKMKQLKPEYFGVNFNIGTTYNRYFGTEIFYQQTGHSTKHLFSDEKLKTSYRAYGLDLNGYLPLSPSFDLTAGIGIATYVLSQKATHISHSSDEGYGYRFSGGLLYHFNKNCSLRAVARYVSLDHISNAHHIAEYVLGLRYNFIKE